MRVKRYSPRTEKTYCYWIRFFIRFHGVRHPASMGAPEIKAFLEYLAVERHVAAATQNQALNALVFLYRHILEQPLGDIGEFSRARRPRRLPVVLSHEEATRVLSHLSGPMCLMGMLMYGSGLRLLETCRLRVRDIEVEGQSGAKSRQTRHASRLSAKPRFLSHPATQLRHSVAEPGHGYPHGSGITRAQERGNHPDLHACAGQGLCRRAQPLRIKGQQGHRARYRQTHLHDATALLPSPAVVPASPLVAIFRSLIRPD
ncbi:hypothetical protein BEI_1384 [Halomonas beimenensis]|uniref:Core-binding (CB) domain-containing protein n=1 Tax=Halomonas beimenensis TaxID=475662 RepID=A0A291P674_9GAMM|nr:hypothetical protein BEI_1384 [Halomonas beimenensis]